MLPGLEPPMSRAAVRQLWPPGPGPCTSLSPGFEMAAGPDAGTGAG